MFLIFYNNSIDYIGHCVFPMLFLYITCPVFCLVEGFHQTMLYHTCESHFGLHKLHMADQIPIPKIDLAGLPGDRIGRKRVPIRIQHDTVIQPGRLRFLSLPEHLATLANLVQV